MHAHSHRPVGDPDALPLLWSLVDQVARALAANEAVAAGAALDAANGDLARLSADENPRTRAQVRALVLVRELLAQGEVGDARELVEGALRRSFPGQVEFD